MVKELTVDIFEEEVLKSDIPVIVDCYATWCGPCKMMAPVVEKVSEKYEGKVKFCKIDIDNAMDIAMKYRVVSIPDFLCFKDGELVDQAVGAMPEAQFEAVVNKLI
ncbi:MAG: thioredoxin [Lachnospiraceae bacterium]|jgi:thioredoxin 1